MLMRWTRAGEAALFDVALRRVVRSVEPSAPRIGIALLAVMIAACGTASSTAPWTEEDDVRRDNESPWWSDVPEGDEETLEEVAVEPLDDDVAPALPSDAEEAPPRAWSNVVCATDADCLERAPFLQCLPSAEGQRWCSLPCTRDVDCPASGFCQLVDVGREQGRCMPASPLCRVCTGNADCGVDGRCVALAGNAGEGRCLQQCDGDVRCTPGFFCEAGVCQPRAGVCGSCYDADGDGFGEGPGCAGPDCDDSDPDVHPGAEERCDDRDWSCSGDPLDGLLGTGDHCAFCGDACPPPDAGVEAWVCAPGGLQTLPQCEPLCRDGFATCGTMGDPCGIDLQTDPFHCGACFQRCHAGERPGAAQSVCIDGRCQDTRCSYRWGRCGTSDACDTSLDSTEHCGACDMRCATGADQVAACDEGRCILTPDCGADEICDDQCVQVASHREHCGACGSRCASRVSMAGDTPLGGYRAQACVLGQCRCVYAGAGSRPPTGAPASCNLLDNACSGIVDAGCPRYAPSMLRVHQLAAQDDLETLLDEGHPFQASAPPEVWGSGAPTVHGAGTTWERLLQSPRQRALLCSDGQWVHAIRVWRHRDHGVLQVALQCVRRGVGLVEQPEPGRALALEARLLSLEGTWHTEGATWIHPAEPVEERTLRCPEGHSVTGLEAALFSQHGVADLRIACQRVSLQYAASPDRPWRLLWTALAWQPWSALSSPSTSARVRGYGGMVLRGLELGVRDGPWDPELERSARGRVLYVGALGIEQPQVPALIPQEGTW